MRKGVGGFKDKIVSLFITDTPKQTVYGRGKKLSKSKTHKQSEEKKEIRDRIIKDRIVINIRTFFETRRKQCPNISNYSIFNYSIYNFFVILQIVFVFLNIKKFENVEFFFLGCPRMIHFLLLLQGL